MDYKPLTKTIELNGRKCICCVNYNTDKCKIHTNNIKGCAECPVLCSMINQLRVFEEVYTS